MASAPSASAPVSGSESPIWTVWPWAATRPARLESMATTVIRTAPTTSERRFMGVLLIPDGRARSLARPPVTGMAETGARSAGMWLLRERARGRLLDQGARDVLRLHDLRQV